MNCNCQALIEKGRNEQVIYLLLSIVLFFKLYVIGSSIKIAFFFKCCSYYIDINCSFFLLFVVRVHFSDSDKNGNGPVADATSEESSSSSESDSEEDSDSDAPTVQKKKNDVKSKPKVT